MSLVFAKIFVPFFLSKSVIPEGRSFQEAPDGFICLDCAKVTVDGRQKGLVYGKEDNKESTAGSSSEAHPVGDFLMFFE